MSSKGSARRSCKVEEPINVDDVNDDDDVDDVDDTDGDDDDDDGSVSGEKDELEADQAVGRV